MATVTVQLYASYAELLGESLLTVTIPGEGCVRDLVDAIRSAPGGASIPRTPLVAVNRRFASPGERIGPNDELALIPPVAGG